MDRRSVLGEVVRHFRSSWKQLALTDLVCKLIAFVLLTPLVGILFRLLLAAAGKTVLADQDILFFLLRPAGWLCGIAVGGLWLGIAALEQAALMAVLCGNQRQRHLNLVGAVHFAGVNAWPVLRVTAQMVGITLLTTAPFLAAAGVVYVTLLGEFDINYYLKGKTARVPGRVGDRRRPGGGTGRRSGGRLSAGCLFCRWCYSKTSVLLPRFALVRNGHAAIVASSCCGSSVGPWHRWRWPSWRHPLWSEPGNSSCLEPREESERWPWRSAPP